MNKHKKIKILEFLIIIIIIISIITIYLLFTKLNKEKPTLSDSENIENYKITKYFEYDNPLDKATIYNIPFYEKNNPFGSEFKVKITSTDNFIIDYRESILIDYLDLIDEERNIITNYCNSYDKIESLYSVRCTFKKDYLQINNLYHISKLISNELTINNIKITLPVNREMKTSDYLNQLAANEITYIQVEK